MEKSIKILLLLIIITLTALAITGSIYFLNTKRIKVYYLKINEKYKIGTPEKVTEAIEEFRELAAKYPKSKYAPKALFQIGQGYQILYKILNDEQKLDIAKKEYSDLAKKYPDSEEAEKALLQVADICYTKGEYNEALGHLNYLLSRYIDTKLKSQVYTKMGYIYLELNDYEKALQAFNQPENTNNDDALVGKAETYIKKGDYEKAISIYEEFIKYRKSSNLREKVIKNFEIVTYNYAKDLASKKDYIRSTMFYNKIIELLPNSNMAESSLYWIGENYYDSRDYENAINYFKKVLENSITLKDDSALLKLGVINFERQKFEEALKYFQKIINEYPKSTYTEIAKKWERQTLRELKYKSGNL